MPRRTSNEAKRLAGTFKPSRERPEPEPIEAELLPPAHLSDAAKAYWRRKAPELQRLGLLMPIDVEAFGLLCAIQVHIDELIANGRMPGRDLMVSYRALINQFGLTPDARARLAWTPPKPARSPGKYDDV